jgi:hypothetical protein
MDLVGAEGDHPRANMCPVSIKGSPYAHFRRALDTGTLALIRTAAAELPQINLDDALRICLCRERAIAAGRARVGSARRASGF